MEEKVKCPRCNGTGVSPESPSKSNSEWPCYVCMGTGYVKEEKK